MSRKCNECVPIRSGGGPARAYRRRVLPATAPTRRAAGLLVLGGASALLAAGVGLLVVAALPGSGPPAPSCPAGVGFMGSGIAVAGVGGTGAGQAVGATEYGGPGDPSSGTVGASGASLLAHPDSYAELGGITFQTATAMGGLPYMTPLRVTLGRPLGGGLQARLRSRRRPRRRAAAGDRPVVAVRGCAADPL